MTDRTERFAATARHNQVLASGPRIDPLTNDSVSADAWNMVNTLRDSIGAGRIDVMPEFMRQMAKHPDIFRCQMEMGTALFRGRIPARERELAVLRISWLSGAPYEWGEHVEIGKRCGLSPDEVERVTQGAAAIGWTEHDAAILRAVEELMADFAISDETWSVLARFWDEQQLIELPMMVGQYLTTAFILNTLRVRLAEGNRGLAHR